jgi:ribosomal-protein-alanine N-acetyltransferase
MSEALQSNSDVILIRHMRSDDLEQVHALDKMSFSMPWPESSYRYELFENPGSLLWVAEVQETGGALQVVGMVVVWLVVDEAHIATIAVHPDYRGRGIAQELLCASLVESIERGMRSATLEVRAHNLAAQRLYRRFRFGEAGLRPRYYRDNFEDALIMTADKLDDHYLQWLKAGAWKKDVEQLRQNPMSKAGVPTENLQEKGHESRG